MVSNMNKNEITCDRNHIHKDKVEGTRKNMASEEEMFDIAEFFKVFADSTRIKILSALFENELCVCDIAACLNMTKSAVSHQLRILRQADLVRNRKEGKIVYYRLSDDHVRKIFEMAKEHLSE